MCESRSASCVLIGCVSYIQAPAVCACGSREHTLGLGHYVVFQALE